MEKAKKSTSERKYHHGDLRRALLDGALDVIAEQGVGALSLRDVARRIGVSHSAPYHHFADKGRMLSALAEEGFVAMHEAMASAVPTGAQTAKDRLIAIGVAYVCFAAQHPAHFRVMFSAELEEEEPASALSQASQATFQQLMGGLKAQGMKEVEARDSALLAWATVHGLAMLWIDGQVARTLKQASVQLLARKVTARLASLLD